MTPFLKPRELSRYVPRPESTLLLAALISGCAGSSAYSQVRMQPLLQPNAVCMHELSGTQLVQVSAKTEDGRTIQSAKIYQDGDSLLRGKEVFHIETTEGALDSDWNYRGPTRSPTPVENEIRVRAWPQQQRDQAAELAFAPSYRCPAQIDLRGASGGRAARGERGRRGEDGPNADVHLSYVDSPSHGRLVVARVERFPGSPPEYYFAKPGPGAIQIDASGGAGGRGGDPLTLERKPSVGGVLFAGQYPDRYEAETGGAGGDGGNGGSVTIHYAAGFPELANMVEVKNRGGPGGAGVKEAAGKPGKDGPPPRKTAQRPRL